MFSFQEVEQADIETQESVIRVVSPTDVQFKLDDQDKEEVAFSRARYYHNFECASIAPFSNIHSILISRTYMLMIHL